MRVDYSYWYNNSIVCWSLNINNKNEWEALIALGLVASYFVLHCIFTHPGTSSADLDMLETNPECIVSFI